MNDPTYILKRGPHIANQPTMHTLMKKEDADLEGYSYLNTTYEHLKQVNIEEWVPTNELEIYMKKRPK